MNTVPTLNALTLVNLTNTIFIHRHCIHWTASLTWSNQVCNRIVWTGFRTFSAFFTERGVNMCPCPSNINRTESAGLLTRFSHAFLTVVRDNITGNRTFFTGCPNNLYHQIIGCTFYISALCQTNPLPHNFSFFIDAATIFCRWSWHQSQWQFVFFLFKFSGENQFCNFF